MNAWGILSKEEGVQYSDIVWYSANCDAEYVRKTLIEHDGYPENIVIVKIVDGEKNNASQKN